MSGERGAGRERLVQVAVAENPATAQMLQDLLQQAGIRSLAKNTDSLSAIAGGLGGMPFTIEISVLEGDAAAAEALLADERPARPAQISAPRRRYRKRS